MNNTMMSWAIHVRKDDFTIYRISESYLKTLKRYIFNKTEISTTYLFVDDCEFLNGIASQYVGYNIYGNVFIVHVLRNKAVYPNGIDIDRLVNIQRIYSKETKENELSINFDNLNINEMSDSEYDNEYYTYYDDVEMHYGLC